MLIARSRANLILTILVLFSAGHIQASEATNKRNCDETKNIAEQAEKLANRGISVTEAKSLLNTQSARKLIDLVYSASNTQERQRIVRDIYSVCQNNKIGWTRNEYKQQFFKSCQDSNQKNNRSAQNLDCHCFSNTLIDSMSESELERARANADIFTDKIKNNPQSYEKCSIR